MEPSTLHPLRTRIAHWTNAVVLLVMLWSGFAMFAADRQFAAYVHLLPAGFWSALQLTGHRLQGRAWHLGMAIVMIANGMFYLTNALRAGRFRRVWGALYHAPQRMAYAGVLGGAGVMVLTGLALWFRHQAPWLLATLGGERIVLPVHVVLALALVAFVVVHVAQVIRAGLPTLLTMIGHRRVAARYVLAASAVLAVAFVGARTASGPSGIPGVLRWAVPARPGAGAHVRVSSRAPRGGQEDRRSDG